MFKKLRNTLQKKSFVNKLTTNYDFRTIVFSLCSFVIGVAFAVYNLCIAIISRSVWYGALGMYYLFLDVIRAAAIFSEYRKRGKEDSDNGLKLYGVCGIVLLVMTIFLNAVIIQLIGSNKIYEYSDAVVYIVAGYTLYRIASAIYNMAKARKNDNYSVRCLRCINFVTALVSFLSLQAAALYAYSRETNHAVVNAITGCIVCVTVAAIGIFMFVNAIIKSKGKGTDNGRSDKEGSV